MGRLAAATNGAPLDFSSNLPLVIIETHRQVITQWLKFLVTATVIDTANGRSSLLGPVEYSGWAEMNIRGNSSRAHPKKAYRLEIQNDTGQDLKVPLLGMPKESDWILYPAYTDKTLVRDALAYELWRAMGYYAPQTRYVELFIHTGATTESQSINTDDPVLHGNGSGLFSRVSDAGPHGGKADDPLTHTPSGSEGQTLRKADEGAVQEFNARKIRMEDYAGIYVLIEKIKRGKHRVNIQKAKPDANDPQWFTGGFIFKKDRPNFGERGFVTRIGARFVYEDPKEKEITPEQQTWLKSRLESMEDVLFGPNFRDPIIGYSAYIDVTSFIDYHWMVEVSKNIDGYWFSQFYHMDRGGKLKMGPIWDWDMSFGNVFYHEGYRTNGWRWDKIRGPHYKWYARMFEDPDFLQRYIDRWSELRADALATSNVLARVDALVAQLQEAQVRNYRRWTNLGVYVHPNRFIGKTYQEEVDWLKQWIVGRLAWIDSQGFPEPTVAGDLTGPQPKVSLSCEMGQIFYTTDGSDPRAPGGEVAKRAMQYITPVALQTNLTVTARVRSDYGLWSAPVKVQTPPRAP